METAPRYIQTLVEAKIHRKMTDWEVTCRAEELWKDLEALEIFLEENKMIKKMNAISSTTNFYVDDCLRNIRAFRELSPRDKCEKVGDAYRLMIANTREKLTKCLSEIAKEIETVSQTMK